MLICEIEKITLGKTRSLGNFIPGPGSQYFGKIDGLELYSEPDEYSPNSLTFYLIDPASGARSAGNVAAKIDMSRFSRSSKVNSWIATFTRIAEKYRGKKLAPKIYARLVRKGLNLISDSTQSDGGQKIWRDLASRPGVFVYAFSRKPGGKYQYRHVDVDDLRSGGINFAVYDDEYEEEAAELEKEIDRLEKFLDSNRIDSKERKVTQAKLASYEKMLKKIVKDQENAQYWRLIAVNNKINESAGVGRITKQNRTADVGPDEISKQAAKFGNSVDRNGRPPLLNAKATKNTSVHKLNNLGIK